MFKAIRLLAAAVALSVAVVTTSPVLALVMSSAAMVNLVTVCIDLVETADAK